MNLVKFIFQTNQESKLSVASIIEIKLVLLRETTNGIKSFNFGLKIKLIEYI